MNSRERMQIAMQNKKADRVPVMCQFSWGHVMLNTGVRPSRFVFDPEGFAEGLWLIREKYNFDGVLINQYSNKSPEERCKIRIETQEDGEMCYLPNGDRILCPYNDNPRDYPANPQPMPEIDAIDPDKIDFKLEVADWEVEAHKRIVALSNGEYSVHGEVVSPFDHLVGLLGLENALMALLLEPEKCKELLERYIEKSFVFAKEQLLLGVNAMKISSPFVGGSFISKEHYRSFVLPFERKLVKKIHEFKPGIPVYTHTCGFIGDRLELMAESGIDGIECLDPPPLGNCELADAKARIGKRMFIKGNMDSVNVLLQATPESLELYVKQKIADGGGGGGFILSSACSVAPYVKPEILKLLVPLAEEYGTYPLNKSVANKKGEYL